MPRQTWQGTLQILALSILSLRTERILMFRSNKGPKGPEGVALRMFLELLVPSIRTILAYILWSLNQAAAWYIIIYALQSADNCAKLYQFYLDYVSLTLNKTFTCSKTVFSEFVKNAWNFTSSISNLPWFLHPGKILLFSSIHLCLLRGIQNQTNIVDCTNMLSLVRFKWCKKRFTLMLA